MKIEIRSSILTIENLLIGLVIIWYFSGQAVRFIMNNSIGLVLSQEIINTLYGTIFIMIILACLLLIKNTRMNFLYFSLIFIAISLFFLATLIMHPEYEYYFTRDIVGAWHELFSPVTGCIYALLIVMIAGNASRIWKSIVISSWINFFYYYILIIIANRRGYWEAFNSSGSLISAEYDLGIGYSLAFIMIVFSCKYLENRKIIYFIAATLSFALTLQNGSRGALLSIGIFLVMILICRRNEVDNNNWKLYLLIISVVIISFVIFFNYNLILRSIGESLFKIGLNSRTISAMINGTMTEDNGRSFITQHAFTAIKDGGFWGLGAYGDRPYIAPYYWWGYSHNIFLELISNFGIFLGSLIIIILSYKILKIIFENKNIHYNNLYILFLSSSAKLLLSDTIWGYPEFWALLGLILMFPIYGKVRDRLKKNVSHTRIFA